MKILCTEYNEQKEGILVPMGDDVLLRNNEDFYIPDFTREVSCAPQFVVRICKLGKTVSERFANRYFEEIGVGVRFYADTLEKELEEKSLPTVVAASFAGSAAISRLVKTGICRETTLEMQVNDKAVYRTSLAEQPMSVERLIALASDFHTLKIGDFLYCGSVFRYRGLTTGDRIRLTLGESVYMDFKIK